MRIGLRFSAHRSHVARQNGKIIPLAWAWIFAYRLGFGTYSDHRQVGRSAKKLQVEARAEAGRPGS